MKISTAWKMCMALVKKRKKKRNPIRLL